MIGRLFRRSRPDTASTAWWQAANAAAERPTPDAIAALSVPPDPPVSLDEAENRTEMIEGLERLASLTEATELPSVTTQHRVIGADVCHFLTPVSLPEAAGAPGKLFVTDRRLVVVGTGVVAVPWHRIRRVLREGRVLYADGAGRAVQVQCNSFGDALVVQHLMRRLGPGMDEAEAS